ncbi:MAG: Hpt domain-containing protein [Nannocystales bacterium]
MTSAAHRRFDPNTLDPDARALMPLFLSTRRADLAELRAALDVGALDLAARVGHRISGTAQSYGFTELGELAVELQQHAEKRELAEVERCAAGVAQWVQWLEELVGGVEA